MMPFQAWSSAPVAALLHRYVSNTFEEAMADVIGVASLADAGRVPWAVLRQHFAQTWCARLPADFTETGNEVHPSRLRRADALVDTLDAFLGTGAAPEGASQ